MPRSARPVPSSEHRITLCYKRTPLGSMGAFTLAVHTILRDGRRVPVAPAALAGLLLECAPLVRAIEQTVSK